MMSSSAERRLAWGLLLFLAGVAGFWAGMRRGDLPLFSTVAAILLIFCFACKSPVRGPCPGWTDRVWWTRDAFFWFGLLFLVYLGIQWWNAGRALYYDVEFRRWVYSAPRHSSLPWAFTPAEAAEMLHWFFSAWSVGLMVRSPLMSRRGATLVVRGVVYSAGLLAVFGIVQYLSGTSRIYGLRPLAGSFFASFAYANHAAAYFVMIGGVAAGLLLREVLRRDRPVDRVHAGLAGVALVLCLTAANLSLSRAGVILAWALAVFVSTYGLVRGWRVLRPSGRVKLMAVTVAVILVFYFAVSGFGSAAIRRQFAVKRPPLHQMIPSLVGVNLDLTVRPLLWQTAWSMFKENAGYGTGGWGFRYLAAFHLPTEQWGELDGHRGRANVHNDPLQFLTEFGLAGVGLMIGALGALAAPLFRRGPARGAVFTMTGAGLMLVMIFSLIDLPFRCPAILWTWVAVLAALPKLSMQAGTECQ